MVLSNEMILREQYANDRIRGGGKAKTHLVFVRLMKAANLPAF